MARSGTPMSGLGRMSNRVRLVTQDYFSSQPTRTKQWFMDDEFDIPLPEWLSEECRQFYGEGEFGIDFAQGLASFLHVKGLDVVRP